MFKYKIDISEIWGSGKCFQVKRIKHNNLIIQDKNRETTAALDKLTKQNQIEKYSKEMFFNSWQHLNLICPYHFTNYLCKVIFADDTCLL